VGKRNNSTFVVSPKSNDSNGKREEKVTFILLAENYGYRMKSYGPLSLIDIHGKTLLEHQIQAISSTFINFEIILCSGFETNKVYHFIQNNFPPSLPIRIVENQVYYHSNCCEGLRLCMNNTMNDKIVVCGGGVLLTTDYLRSLNTRRSSIMYQLSDKKENFEVGIVKNEANRLENLSLAVRDRVWTELLYITGTPLVKSFYNMVSKPELKNKFLFEAINNWRGRKSLHLEENANNSIIKIDNIKTLKRIKKK
jgi:choline kinase|tara:strand:- start:2656 stop:3414 length:759 start_codon:yes stop_codon:yes gene_type:complete